VNLFVTATDTGAGKTYFTSLLIRALRRAGLDTVGFKPVCCGGREDAEEIERACGSELSLNQINPVWMRAPAAPYAATLIENRPVDLDLIRDTYASLRKSHDSLVVEGIGGWLVPITRDYFVSDLARDLGLPVAVVVGNRLGALNHTLLTVRSIQSLGIPIHGLVLNNLEAPSADPATTTNRALLEDLLNVPVLFEIAHGQRSLELGIA
jgi:dethiobiotin synthetase